MTAETFSLERPAVTDRRYSESLVAQCRDRIEARGAIRGNEREDPANHKGADANNGDIPRHNFRRNFRELVNLSRKDWDVERARQPLAEFVSVTDQRHAQAKTGQRSKNSHDDTLTE